MDGNQKFWSIVWVCICILGSIIAISENYHETTIEKAAIEAGLQQEVVNFQTIWVKK